MKSKIDVSVENFSPSSITVKINIRMDSNLFAQTGVFALLFITEEMFHENKNNLAIVRNMPFASIYAFYNKSGGNNLVYTISSKSGGKLNFTPNNITAFNVEIKMNSHEDWVLGYVGSYTVNTVIKIAHGDITLFPVFKKYLARDNEIYTIISKLNAKNLILKILVLLMIQTLGI